MTTLVVSGLARCGSSLTMQMLHAAGMHCAAAPPDFADERFMLPGSRITKKLLARYDAIRLLELHLLEFEAGADFAVLWLDRNSIEQARSQLKMIGHIFPRTIELDGGARTALDNMARGIREDMHRAQAKIAGRHVYRLNFEDLVGFPFAAAGEIARFVKEVTGRELSPVVMGSRVLKRGPECQPDMRIEYQLIRERNKPTCLFPRS